MPIRGQRVEFRTAQRHKWHKGQPEGVHVGIGSAGPAGRFESCESAFKQEYRPHGGLAMGAGLSLSLSPGVGRRESTGHG
jgi:hypothetical protein